MEFTYDAYRNLLMQIGECGYHIATYKNWQEMGRCVILRHDIDYDIDKAVRLAEIESTERVTSTYFVLLTSDFYNVFSKESHDALRRIKNYGHTIGLHFDEVCYPELSGNVEAVIGKILEEAELLGRAVGERVDIVSMHRPSKLVLEADICIPGMINSYGKEYFKDFKYLSDSRRRWREPVKEIIGGRHFERLHILTHAFWYNESEEDIHKTISSFINSGSRHRYQIMGRNITDLESIMPKVKVL